MNITDRPNSAIDNRTSGHERNLASQGIRKRVEERLAWGTDGQPMRKTRALGPARGAFVGTTTAGRYSLLRVAKLLNSAPATS
jgi:hypothetical protein